MTAASAHFQSRTVDEWIDTVAAELHTDDREFAHGCCGRGFR